MDRHRPALRRSARRAYNPEGIRHRAGEKKTLQFPRREGVGPPREFKDLRRQTSNSAIPQHQDRACGGSANSAPHRPPPDELDLRHQRFKETANHGPISTCICAPNGPAKRRSRLLGVLRHRAASMDSHIEQVEELFLRGEDRIPSTWNISTSTTASMRASGKQKPAAALPDPHPEPGTCCINIRTTTRVGVRRLTPSDVPHTKSWVPAASVEHVNEGGRIGLAWKRIHAHLPANAVWLNPVAQRHWDYSESDHPSFAGCFSERMFPIHDLKALTAR